MTIGAIFISLVDENTLAEAGGSWCIFWQIFL
jgi:hypothetical protein